MVPTGASVVHRSPAFCLRPDALTLARCTGLPRPYGLRPVAPRTDFLNSLLNSQIAKNRLVWSSVQLPRYNLRSATLARCATDHDRPESAVTIAGIRSQHG